MGCTVHRKVVRNRKFENAEIERGSDTTDAGIAPAPDRQTRRQSWARISGLQPKRVVRNDISSVVSPIIRDGLQFAVHPFPYVRNYSTNKSQPWARDHFLPKSGEAASLR